MAYPLLKNAPASPYRWPGRATKSWLLLYSYHGSESFDLPAGDLRKEYPAGVGRVKNVRVVYYLGGVSFDQSAVIYNILFRFTECFY
jgi:hypothetical protein